MSDDKKWKKAFSKFWDYIRKFGFISKKQPISAIIFILILSSLVSSVFWSDSQTNVNEEDMISTQVHTEKIESLEEEISTLKNSKSELEEENSNLSNKVENLNKEIENLKQDVEKDEEIQIEEKDKISEELDEVEDEVLEKEEIDIEKYFKEKIEEVMGYRTNQDLKTVIDVYKSENGIVDITLRANDNFTNNMLVNGMLIDSKDLFKEVYKDKTILEKINGISLIYMMELVDSYGNVDDYAVHIITLETETIDKINWTNFLYENLPNVADTYFLHDVLKK